MSGRDTKPFLDIKVRHFCEIGKYLCKYLIQNVFLVVILMKHLTLAIGRTLKTTSRGFQYTVENKVDIIYFHPLTE